MTDQLTAAAAGVGLQPSFQQVVSLPDGATVGYEALARWPGMDGLGPLEVFAHAKQTSQLDVLDRQCIHSAARGALDGAWRPGMLLLINCEPTTSNIHMELTSALAAAASAFDVVFEFTERGLLTNPAALLAKASALRTQGFKIAMDDLGAHTDSLALLDIIEPEFLKLDLNLVQRQPDRIQARTIAGIIAHHERTGAVILAEGIETDEHLEQALAYGATLGQGYLFGRPGALTHAPDRFVGPARSSIRPLPEDASTFALVRDRLRPRTVRFDTLHELSRHIERLATSAESPPMVLATVQDQSKLSASTMRTYTEIAHRAPLVAMFGAHVPCDLGHGIRGVHLATDDPLMHEWTILVLGPEIAAGLIAREVSPPGTPQAERRFDMVITFDRALVTLGARCLLSRLSQPSAS
ncbi:EAL domain-containing protein [Mycolicibacterium sp. 018/SC-01/001]|uniref:EAL domain-containing protein n=1 Tax=Mycolicibacterium sp. 018/SC-01/001 TaxID=2592069 RepID=UPI001180AB50|nr:EAL domain-containing protein [Mycolicibacterium sp. 018/SC-01/001]TRW80445.1 EAL domain-containing protein [Mycolicibacterium sp. 018/SC-01/001]